MARGGAGPFAVVTWSAGETPAVCGLLLCGAIESYALLALYRREARGVAVAAGAIALAALSLATPLLFNADLYAYVGNGILGLSAYTPPHLPFAGELHAINVWWGVPVPPATYGPLWLVTARLLTGSGAILVDLLGFRLLGLTMLASIVALLHVSNVPRPLLALVALNPALYWQFVLDGHNDLIPTAIVLVAAAVAASGPGLSALLIAVAALFKAPFALLGLPVLIAVRSPSRRWIAAGVAVAVAASASAIAGGPGYAAALLRQVGGSGTLTAFHALAAAAAVALIAGALAGPKRLRTAAWLLPAVAPYAAPWYALWSLPYASSARRALVYLLVALPLVAVLLEPSLARWWTVTVCVPLAAILSIRLPRRKPPPA